MRMLSKLERRQPKYLCNRKGDVNLSSSAEYRRTLNNLKEQAIALLTEQYAKLISLVFLPVPLLHVPTPTIYIYIYIILFF